MLYLGFEQDGRCRKIHRATATTHFYYFLRLLKTNRWGGSSGLVVMGGDSRTKVVGLNPSTIYWMDTFHIYLL